jgi:peptidoglycan hydrolase FlgJ
LVTLLQFPLFEDAMLMVPPLPPLAGAASTLLPHRSAPSAGGPRSGSGDVVDLASLRSEGLGTRHDPGLTSPGSGPSDELKQAFQDFVGQTIFGQMLASMRSTVGKPAYLHGGRSEEIFQQQLDQVLVEEISRSSADRVADPMFELFNLQRPA